MLARQPAAEVPGQGPLGQLVGVAEVAPGQGRVAEVVQRDPAERDVDPDVVAAALEGEPQGVAGGLGAIRPSATWTQMLSPQPWRANRRASRAASGSPAFRSSIPSS
jgi:hypothetical protein